MTDQPNQDAIDQLSGRTPGADEEDPYEEIDIETLPEWWQKAIEEHRRYELRPYRPPRFTDGEIYPEVRRDLEATHNIDLTLICFDIETNTWDIIVDGETIGEVTRLRSPEGYSVIGMESDAFEELVEDVTN